MGTVSPGLPVDDGFVKSKLFVLGPLSRKQLSSVVLKWFLW